ncbi:GNAT family N-acetyltransferase [Radiobacillus kanasensis]|uniref:GNAT family N-acetyltransferase n=1 Tax=Radiobacillus kanasensis TaxID=2844358 RepID=UPI001E5D6173|nr:GNAT family N-acetyltransferase [Radiobacillus kanasensis]UFT99632.1 GNAT family N-acetyltransferase [Radiobacillus kanasensis]
MDRPIHFRTATMDDVSQIVKMLANDPLGSQREHYADPLPPSYDEAFQAIDSDPNNELIVGCLGQEVIGVAQITFTPYLTHQGSWRATIEGVRTSSDHRGNGIGSLLIKWAIERAKERKCQIVQLTTDKTREDALRFYTRLGFQPTHEGLKLNI